LNRPRDRARFRGFSADTVRFFETLDRDPCPDAWPAGARVTYAAHVLGPLKALVADLEADLRDVADLVAFEARVGGSLSWPGRRWPSTDECSVRRLRAWARGRDPESSPLLFAGLSAAGIEIGLAAEGADPGATRQLARSLAADREMRGVAAGLLARGWAVTGETRARGRSLPADLRPWAWSRGLRVTRVEPWSAWIGEPAFAGELGDRFRELLPAFERMAGRSARVSARGA
jgi:hypothetical protein